MGSNREIQHQAATIYNIQLFQSSRPPFLSSCSSLFERKFFGFIRKPTAATCSQGGQIVEKSTFKKPKWLLRVEKRDENYTKEGVQKRSLFQVMISTSKDYGSGMSDLCAGVLLALIGEDGSCFVHRLSNLVNYEENGPSLYRFQRSAQDVVTFSGPDLGKLATVWVAPEQGTWRIEDIIVRVSPEPVNKNNGAGTADNGGKILQYNFECEEALMGEDEPMSAVELQVSSISEISYEDFLDVNSGKKVNGLHTSWSQERDVGMREYEVLKFSLLSYDALLVIAGSAIAAVAGHKEVSEGFLVGGILGFFYLFILERAVDELPGLSSSPLRVSTDQDSPATSERKSTTGKDSDDMKTSEKSRLQQTESLSGFRAPLTRLSVFLATCLLIAKAIDMENHQALSKEMLLAGAAGFLMTKVATVLASNAPFKGGEA